MAACMGTRSRQSSMWRNCLLWGTVIWMGGGAGLQGGGPPLAGFSVNGPGEVSLYCSLEGSG